MTDLDDGRLEAALRAYLSATDAVARAVAMGDDRALMDRADERAIAAMAVRRRLVELGWSAPPRPGSVPVPDGEAAGSDDPA